MANYYGSGQGKLEKLTGPPSPASASSRLMMTAIAASPLPSRPSGGSGGEADGVVPVFVLFPDSGAMGESSPPAALRETLFRIWVNAGTSSPRMLSTSDACSYRFAVNCHCILKVNFLIDTPPC